MVSLEKSHIIKVHPSKSHKLLIEYDTNVFHINLKQFLSPIYYIFIKSYLDDCYVQICYWSASNIACIEAGVSQWGIYSSALYTSDQHITINTQIAEYIDDIMTRQLY